ncbi:hypothetical protein T440DRAFT_120306 [Plenodomus tracheiphilus IPT5]|uniref:Uncharacterized protein n=1 Tax=Plenodomus tracheiphilus IPT5 TaxID=1408161 RepID=A0A6A7B363_9PLEO|nr:hypothetical protein T440DRAFT_120306 [Plenodomus tracheiphilus IPT5]
MFQAKIDHCVGVRHLVPRGGCGETPLACFTLPRSELLAADSFGGQQRQTITLGITAAIFGRHGVSQTERAHAFGYIYDHCKTPYARPTNDLTQHYSQTAQPQLCNCRWCGRLSSVLSLSGSLLRGRSVGRSAARLIRLCRVGFGRSLVS